MARSRPNGAPTLLFIIGPVAVGKMSVGFEVAARTGFRLFHNHLTIEPVVRFFEFGSPPFDRLVGEFRRRKGFAYSSSIARSPGMSKAQT